MIRRSVFGYRLAQVGGSLMIVGGLFDLGTRELMPHHLAALGGAGAPPEAATELVLALLHALGGALVAAGIAVLVLMRAGRRTGYRFAYVAAGAVALLAEGPNAWGMWNAGTPLFVAPLGFMVLVASGAALCAAEAGNDAVAGTERAAAVHAHGRGAPSGSPD